MLYIIQKNKLIRKMLPLSGLGIRSVHKFTNYPINLPPKDVPQNELITPKDIPPNSSLIIKNNEFLYGLTSVKFQSNNLIIVQFNGTLDSIPISTIHPITNRPVSVVAALLIDDSLNILSCNVLWYYNGIREEQQYVQVISQEDSIMIVSSYNGDLVFKNISGNNQTLKDNNYFLAKFKLKDNIFLLDWLLPIKAYGTQSIYLTLDPSGNEYLTGTFNKSLNIGSTGLKSTLINDAFLSKVNSQGEVLWLKNYSDIIKDHNSYIRGKSITYVNDSLVMISQYGTEQPGLWVSNINLNGDILWTKLIKGKLGVSQVITDNTEIFLIGTLTGELIIDDFHTEINSKSVYLIKLSLDGTLTGFNSMITNIPDILNPSPHIIYNQNLYITLFINGELIMGGNEYQVESGVSLVIIKVDENGNFQVLNKIDACVPNSCGNCIPYKDGLLAIASNVVIPGVNTDLIIKYIN